MIFKKQYLPSSIKLSLSGLIAAFLACLLILGVGTYSYNLGYKIGNFDAQHDAWNVGYVLGREDALAHACNK